MSVEQKLQEARENLAQAESRWYLIGRDKADGQWVDNIVQYLEWAFDDLLRCAKMIDSNGSRLWIMEEERKMTYADPVDIDHQIFILKKIERVLQNEVAAYAAKRERKQA